MGSKAATSVEEGGVIRVKHNHEGHASFSKVAKTLS